MNPMVFVEVCFVDAELKGEKSVIRSATTYKWLIEVIRCYKMYVILKLVITNVFAF